MEVTTMIQFDCSKERKDKILRRGANYGLHILCWRLESFHSIRSREIEKERDFIGNVKIFVV